MKRGTGLSLLVAALLMVPAAASASDDWRPYRSQLRSEIRREIREAMRDAQRARFRARRDVMRAFARDRWERQLMLRDARREARLAARDARRAARDARRRSWWY